MKRPMTQEDLRDKGLPFACNNCGAKPTAEDVVRLNGDCDVCGDKIITYTIDTACLLIRLQANAPAHVRAEASNVQQLVGDLKRSCDNCEYKVPEKTRLASQPKCERPIDNMDDACHNFAKWIPNARLDRPEGAKETL